MALSYTNLNTQSSLFWTGVSPLGISVALPASALIAVEIMCIEQGAGLTNSISNSGTALTWTKRVSARNSSAFQPALTEIWTAENTSSQTVTVTISCLTGESTFATDGNAAIVVIGAWTGYDTSSPFGVTGASVLNGSNAGTLNYSLSGTAASTSQVVAVVSCDGDYEAPLVDGGTGWTEAYKQQDGTRGWHRGTSEYILGAVSSVDFGALNDPYQYASCALEIKAAGGGSTAPVARLIEVRQAVKRASYW